MKMDREWQKRFAGFDDVWKRVSDSKEERPSCPCRAPDTAKLLPKKEKKSAAVRFCPRG